MKQENSANEYEIIIDLLGNKTKPPEAYDSHLSDEEEKSFFEDVPYGTLILSYRNYFHDFVSYGYTPDKYLDYARKKTDQEDWCRFEKRTSEPSGFRSLTVMCSIEKAFKNSFFEQKVITPNKDMEMGK